MTTTAQTQITSETQTALDDSIAHWERMATGNRREGEKPRAEQCALCRMFCERSPTLSCAGCPIAEHTKRGGCEGTPYYLAYVAYTEFGLDSPEFKDAALKEVEFLKRLRL